MMPNLSYRRLATLSVMLCVLAVTQPSRGEEPADPFRPSAIATQSVPTVPHELIERLRQYQNMREASFAGWSPDGDGMLVATRFGNATQLHRVYVPGGRREQITFFDEPVSGRFVPSSRDGAVLATLSQGGSENDQIYLVDRAAFSTTLLTDGKSRNLLGPVRHNGEEMIVLSTRRNGRDTDLYLANVRQAQSASLLMQTDSEFWTAHDWSLDGKRLLLSRYVSINEGHPALFDVASKERTPLPLPADGPASVGHMAFRPDGKVAYVTTDARGEFLELGRLDLNERRYDWPVGDLHWDVNALEVDPNSGRVAIAVNADGASKLYLLDGNDVRPLDLPLGIAANLQFSPDGKQLGLTLARPDAPSDAYSIRLDDAELVRWTFSETGGLDPAGFVKPSPIQVTSFDGRQIPAYYFRPPNASSEHRAAVLISIHGGPESQYRPFFSPITQFEVRELGIAVIAPNVRGSAGYGKTYLKLDNAERREDSVKDIGAILDWVAQQPELDPSRVAVVGGSYGGFMVLSSLVHFPDRIKAGIDIVGIANFITFLERTSPYRQDLRRAEYGDERKPEMRAVFEKINPTAGADKIRAALLVAHGRNDPRVPFSEAEQIGEKVRAAGRPVWTVYADNEGHGFAKKDNRDYLTAVQVLFLKAFLDLD
ncbi:MAG TPA: alpha/beta fold hydrolase [Pirellulales bacterium]|nr:alpha/beta fold hydrolase [Pirellulales bacterium]